jgi:hypothetical protein
MSARADVAAGICGHTSVIEAATNDGRAVSFTIETTCDNIERLVGLLDERGSVDAFAEINPRAESAVIKLAREAACCTDCVVAAAALKAMRVAAGLALTADVAIGLTKE